MKIDSDDDQEREFNEDRATEHAPGPDERPDELTRRMRAWKVTQGITMTDQARLDLDGTIEAFNPLDPPPLDEPINAGSEDPPVASRDLDLWPGLLYCLRCSVCGTIFEERANEEGHPWNTKCEDHRGKNWVPPEDRPLANPDEDQPPIASRDLELEPFKTYRLRCRACGDVYEEPVAESGKPWRTYCPDHLDKDDRDAYFESVKCPLCPEQPDLPEDEAPVTEGTELCTSCLKDAQEGEGS